MPDLITIPGIPELWTQTKGDSRIKIAILDGAADLDRACFQGAKISQFKPYWAEDIELNEDYYHYLKLTTDFNQQQKAKKEQDPDHDKDEAKKERDAFFEHFPEPIRARIDFSSHATHIASTILGQHGSPVAGIAPNCTAINIPITFADNNFISFVNLTHAINEALKAEVNIIHIAACHPTQSGIAQEIFARAVKQCQDSNILIVAPGGNDKGECWCIPAILPDVLTVGAMRDDGQPFKFSNYGGDYQEKGVMANGENILGATPGTDVPVREKGTSCAAPIVTGISALLMSLQLQKGEKPNAEKVRQAILQSAIPCDPKEVEEPERCLLGKLNIAGAYQLLIGKSLTAIENAGVMPLESNIPSNRVSPLKRTESSVNKSLITVGDVIPSNHSTTIAIAPITVSETVQGITASAASKRVYVLGSIGYDFGNEARRDSFKQLMPAVEIDGIMVPTNPYDARQLVNYLAENPSEHKSLIWTINQELNPIYAIAVKGGFAADVYETLQLILAGQIEPENSDNYIERVSIPGELTDQKIELFSGQEVPVITVNNVRGMYGWKVNSLVDAALQILSEELADENEIQMRRSLSSFLKRVYFELQNLGQTAKDRALNFAATNAFQAASSFAQAISTGMELDTIEVEKSPFCRVNSDCWDIKLKFFDPDRGLRAKKVYLFTIDVSYLIPVTLGEVRSWSVRK
jgi:cyanobactin maturation PatA/PatG family protease